MDPISSEAPAPATDPLAAFHPIIQRWFRTRLGDATEPQRQGWPLVRSGRDVLIAAPTGSGKTLSAFLWSLGEVTAAPAGQVVPAKRSLVHAAAVRGVSLNADGSRLATCASKSGS